MSFAPQFDSSGGTGLLLPDPPLRKKRGTGGNFPPIDWDDFGGVGGGGGGDDDDDFGDDSGDGFGEQPSRKREIAAEFGLGLGLTAVAVLFLTFLGAYVYLASEAGEWPDAQISGAELRLWLSTAILLASSLCMATAVRAGRLGVESSVIPWLAAALLCSVMFLVAQAQVWRTLHIAGLLPSSNGYGAIFYTLTGLHGAHVLAGVAYLATLIVRLRQAKEPYLSRSTVRLCGVYWHFVGAIWLVLFCVL